MTLEDLSEQVLIDVEHTDSTLVNLTALLRMVAGREPTVHEVAAMGAYVRDAYQGLENILIRFAKFHGVDLPNASNWHVQLVDFFRDPPRAGLPVLFPEPFAIRIENYRGFRHRFHKGYAIHLKWDKMQPLASEAESVFSEFHKRVMEQLSLLWKP